MPPTRRLSKPVVRALDESKILGVRAGEGEHRFTGVWVVVVEDRVFIRSWNDKRTGWREGFRAEPQGVIQLLSGREIRIRARPVRGERLLDAVDAAYAAKYHTPASRKWVRGFATPRRRATTVELTPR
jgi:hypothetical protein